MNSIWAYTKLLSDQKNVYNWINIDWSSTSFVRNKDKMRHQFFCRIDMNNIEYWWNFFCQIKGKLCNALKFCARVSFCLASWCIFICYMLHTFYVILLAIENFFVLLIQIFLKFKYWQILSVFIQLF